jgi:7-carboxy-7-deazaguanine synthase
MSAPLPIHERFFTFQGEGVFTGMPSFFIRTYGCPVHCPWCDSAGTWHKDYVPGQVNRMDARLLAQEARDSGAKVVVITGGEPMVHQLRDLVCDLHDMNIRVHIETCGAFEPNAAFDWITVSPKRWAKNGVLDRKAVGMASEFKIIVEGPGDIDYYLLCMERAGYMAWKDKPIWLHPEWSKHKDPVVLKAIIDAVKNRPDVFFRAGWQLHKLYAVDSHDLRSKPLVPLGGNPALGF